jgi:predicted enzyme related to lactoylglutathione lyase
MNASSRFVWHDFNTKDVDGAKRFYSELFNWQFESSENASYVHIKAGDQMIGGLRQSGPHEHGPASWLGYVGVDDVNATVAAVTAHGGKVYMPTTVMANVGTFAVVADPLGAAFAPWKSARPGEDREPTGKPAPYTFCWDELLTSNVETATRFYGEILGWRVEKLDMPGMQYTLLKRTGVKDEMGADKNAGGVMQSPRDAPHPPFWLTYVAVPDADATIEKAKRLGAQIMMGPMDIPNVGRFAVMLDPQKAAIAVLAAAPPPT